MDYTIRFPFSFYKSMLWSSLSPYFVRFNNRRLVEELDVVMRKGAHLSVHTEGSSVFEKLQQEVREYKEILKCSICHDSPKEVKIQ